MPFNLLLLPLLGGFLFFSHWNRTAFFAKRQEKERLLLYSSLWGVVFLAISFSLSILISYSHSLSSVRTWWAFNTPHIEYSGISSFAFFLGATSQWVFNKVWPFSRIWNEEDEGVRSLLKYGSQLEKMLFWALIEEKHVMVTLKAGKVYIGRIAISLTPQEDRDLLLLPIKSGYRDDKQRLMLTTHYDEAYKAIEDNESEYVEIISDFGVVIPIPEILTASLYREDVHIKYFVHKEGLASELPATTEPNQLPQNQSAQIAPPLPTKPPSTLTS